MALGGFLSALGQGFSGYSTDQQLQFKQQQLAAERARQATLDAQNKTLQDAQVGEYQAQAQQRRTTAEHQANSESTLQRDWSAAIGGDKDAQSRIVAYRPDLASEFQPKAAPDPYGGRTRQQWLADLGAEKNAKLDPNHWSAIPGAFDKDSGNPIMQDTLTGETKVSPVGQMQMKGGGASNERAGQAAAFLARLKMGKADFDNNMQFVRDYHQKLINGDATITPAMMAEAAAARTAPNTDAKGFGGGFSNAAQGYFQGAANDALSGKYADYQRYTNLMPRLSFAMASALPRMTKQMLGIEEGFNQAKSGDPKELISDNQRRLDTAYNYLFANPEGMLQRSSTTPAANQAPQGKRTTAGFDYSAYGLTPPPQ